MIDRLKRKIVIMATVFMFILMTVLILVMNLVNYYGIISECDAVLDVIMDPGAPFFDDRGQDMRDDADKPPMENGERKADKPPMEDGERETPPPKPEGEPMGLPPGMSKEVPYESRFFIVTVSNTGDILQSDMSRIVTVDEQQAKEYIDTVMGSTKTGGFVRNFRYRRQDDAMGSKIYFLDCGRKLDSFRSFLLISVISGIAACVAVMLAFMLTAGRIVAPIAESYEKQKRFISDAGHEIKTPLTIINANVDLLELDGEKEELGDIRQQTARLTKLTENLITLSKMEESSEFLQKTDFPVSDLVSETADSFKAPAQAGGCKLLGDITPGISMNGSPDSIRQLVSILLENAVKYSAPGGNIEIKMTAQKKAVTLSVYNTTEDEMDEKELTRVFDRFYRTDRSRNSETGGHGIGLSMAKAIVNAHGGEISAHTKSGHDFCVKAVLPLHGG